MNFHKEMNNIITIPDLSMTAITILKSFVQLINSGGQILKVYADLNNLSCVTIQIKPNVL